MTTPHARSSITPAYILSVKEIHALSNTLEDQEIGLRCGNHYINFRAYPNTFTGVDLVRWLLNHDIVINKEDAMMVGSQLLVMRRIIAASGKSIGNVATGSTRRGSIQSTGEHHEQFVDDRTALYSFAEGSHTNQPRRARMRLKKADSTIFSKGKWSGFLGGRRKIKKKLTQREKLRVDNVLVQRQQVGKAQRKLLTKIVQRRRSVDADRVTALEIAVDQGFDYREVLIPPHVPIYGTSDGCVYRERQQNESAPPKYQFHYDIASTRRSAGRSAASVTVPLTNKKLQNRVCFYMMGETDRARRQGIEQIKLNYHAANGGESKT